MNARRLSTKYLEKPWGRDMLPPFFPDGGDRRIGEVWFDDPPGEHPVLLVKYIFTSERLSIQVHPGEADARQRGLPGGKTECWYILDAEPDALLGIGTHEPMSDKELRAAALDGSLEQKISWVSARPGDFFLVPAGTVHAIGAGIALVEVQQNVDITYRLYDYGRPRELHLDDGVAVATAKPYHRISPNLSLIPEADLTSRQDAPFVVKLRSYGAGDVAHIGGDGPGWFIPLTGTGTLDGQRWHGGECWLLDGPVHLASSEPSRILIATLS